MISKDGSQFISPSEAAARLGVSVRRVYDLVSANRIRAQRIGGRLLIDQSSVDAWRAWPHDPGRPFSARRAWALVLLASGAEPPGLDLSTRSKLRSLLRARDLWSMRARLVRRAEKQGFRAHSSDLPRIEAEPGLLQSGARHASDAGLGLVAGDAPVEAYVTKSVRDRLVSHYRLAPSERPNVVLRVLPGEVSAWLNGRVAPRLIVALDLAEDLDPRSQDIARQALSRS